MKSILTLTAAIAIATTGCGSTRNAQAPSITLVPTAYAQTSTAPTLITPLIPDIGEKCLSTPQKGCVEFESRRPDGTGYFLQLQLSPVTPDNSEAYGYIKLPYDFRLKRLDSWIGTGLGSRLESGGWFQYRKPTGETAQFFLEFDKHTDVQGEKQRQWYADGDGILLPTGTEIVFYHGKTYAPAAVNSPNCGSSGECAVHVRFFLYSE